jgi:nucleoside-diphosphate-sugar epimerase
VAGGHDVVGTTRRADRLAAIETAGGEAVVLDVLDREATMAVVVAVRPDAVVHQLTDLSARDFAANSRLRIDGTRHLVDAAVAAGVERMVTQSIAWVAAPGEGPADEDDPLDEALPAAAAVRALEEATAELPSGVVLRYGLLYGPGTFYAADGAVADQARRGTLVADGQVAQFLHVDDAAGAAFAALRWPAGVVNVVDDEPTIASEWVPAFCAAIGVPSPPVLSAARWGRVVRGDRAGALGWRPEHPTWRPRFGL